MAYQSMYLLENLSFFTEHSLCEMCLCNSFIVTCCIVFYCMDLKQFIYPFSCSWALKSRKIFPLINKVAMNILIKSLCPHGLDYLPRSGVVGTQQTDPPWVLSICSPKSTSLHFHQLWESSHLPTLFTLW